MRAEIPSLLVLVSRILDYPDQSLYDECKNLDEFVKKHLTSEKIRKEAAERLRPLFSLKLKDLQELYVETFDYKEKSGLYLTAQELGDSRKRGIAIIQLQQLIAELGFEHVSNELSDYIPMLFELVAVAPENKAVHDLKLRLAYAVNRIYTHLSDSNPYYYVFDLLMTFVFEEPKAEEIARLENGREKADLDPLPYPMIYQ